MTIRTILPTCSLLLAATLSLASCGGGGGDGGGGGSSSSGKDVYDTSNGGSWNSSGAISSSTSLIPSGYNKVLFTINCTGFRGTFYCNKGGGISNSGASVTAKGDFVSGSAVPTQTCTVTGGSWSQSQYGASSFGINFTINTNKGTIRITGMKFNRTHISSGASQSGGTMSTSSGSVSFSPISSSYSAFTSSKPVTGAYGAYNDYTITYYK